MSKQQRWYAIWFKSVKTECWGYLQKDDAESKVDYTSPEGVALWCSRSAAQEDIDTSILEGGTSNQRVRWWRGKVGP